MSKRNMSDIFYSILSMPLAQTVRTVGHISNILGEVSVVKLISLNKAVA